MFKFEFFKGKVMIFLVLGELILIVCGRGWGWGGSEWI